MVDRSKRYDNPVHPDKQGKKSAAPKGEDRAEDEAKKTVKDPPTAESPKGALGKTDDGPEPGRGAAFGEVAERHKREVDDMHKRHAAEVSETMTGIHERHAKETNDLGKRHGKEIEEHWASHDDGEPEGGGAPKEVKDGEGPKLGKTEKESETGGEEIKKGPTPKLGKTEDKGDKGTEP